ncbi:MAG: class I SAM-dependent methyltransferase, partial [Candidatus Methanoperedenaceae archaeon]|nr:class I SAM-dependent methyltransferase [Candidatus Methanoperedenaceae archaeon]
RQEFIKRSNLTPNARVLDFGGMLSDELPSAVFGITAPGPLTNAILIKPTLLPFKNNVFDAVVSYHYFDLISSEILGYAFDETARILNKNSSFSFMITLWAPQNEAQRSSLLFDELLKSTGTFFNHDIEEISRMLSASCFSEITVESVKREIPIPKEYVRSHLLMLGNLVKKEKAEGGAGIKALAKQYFNHVKEHGEAMLPALHFTAKKL